MDAIASFIIPIVLALFAIFSGTYAVKKRNEATKAIDEKNIATAKAERDITEAKAKAQADIDLANAEAKRRIEAMKDAKKTREDISSLSDDDLNSELLKYARSKDGNEVHKS